MPELYLLEETEEENAEQQPKSVNSEQLCIADTASTVATPSETPTVTAAQQVDDPRYVGSIWTPVPLHAHQSSEACGTYIRMVIMFTPDRTDVDRLLCWI
eukprot:SAG31_NODE_1745_length_7379_cov_8.772115_6_plen_100_part_00